MGCFSFQGIDDLKYALGMSLGRYRASGGRTVLSIN